MHAIPKVLVKTVRYQCFCDLIHHRAYHLRSSRCLLLCNWITAYHAPEFSLEGSRGVIDLSFSQNMEESDYTGDETTILSEGSSISRFPTFNFSLNTVSSLSSILHVQKPMSISSKATLLLGVLEVDGPSYVKVKTGQYAGSEVALVKFVVGYESGALCKMIAWRETAELWGGLEEDSGMKRGDIILVESMVLAPSFWFFQLHLS
jgi:Shieldin complex subunit 2, first OB fold domain